MRVVAGGECRTNNRSSSSSSDGVVVGEASKTERRDYLSTKRDVLCILSLAGRLTHCDSMRGGNISIDFCGRRQRRTTTTTTTTTTSHRGSQYVVAGAGPPPADRPTSIVHRQRCCETKIN